MLTGCLKKKYIFSSALLMIFVSVFICRIAISEGAAEATKSSAQVTSSHVDASESGKEGAQEGDRSADLLDLLYRFIAFTVLVIILVYGIRKAKVMDYLSLRSDEIRKKLEDLKKAKETAESKCKDMEQRLAEFESKKNEILEQYRKEGLAEKDRILNEAKERVQQILDQSELEIDQEFRSVRNRLKQEIVDLSVQQAKEIIKKSMNEKDHDNLINEFVERVGRN
jgi:F-type H+-transporting ATPase subunit b